MKHTVLLAAALFALASVPVRAAWYWPFGNDEDSPDSPPRLHRLLENANDLIEQAEDASLDGDAEKALELYNAALTNLVDVAAKNPDRAEKPEFAPLRNKIAATSAAIDSIRFAQVNQNIRAVAVTDTTELQRKYDEEQAKKKGGGKTDAAKKDAEKANAGKNGADASKKSSSKVSSEASSAKAADDSAVKANSKSGDKGVVKAPPKDGGKMKAADADRAAMNFDESIQTAIRELKAKDYAAADLLLEDLEKERKDDLNVLILRSAAQSGLKYYLAARRTLEKAMRAHPKNYIPYYNLAHLMFKIEGEGVDSARQYYELGRALGGPRDSRLEAKLK